MLIENTFTVAAPPDDLWKVLLDVERIAPCMPGAELTETVDERTWKGKVNLKFGPVTMSFAGTVEMTERDDAAHRVALRAKGTEQRGKGAANATVTSWLVPGSSEAESTIKMQADITLTGAAAQLSRGLLPEVSKKLTQQFADCLQSTMQGSQGTQPEPETTAAPASGEETAVPHPAGAAAPAPSTPAAARPAPAAAKPVSGIHVGLSAIWSLIVGLIKRLFGGTRSS